MFIMKKFKKILSVVSATVLCAVPIVNVAPVNASGSPKMKTYVVYSVATRPDIAYFDYTLYYSDSVIFQGSKPMNLLSKGNFSSIPKTSNRKVQHKYSGSAIGSRGEVVETKFVVSMDTESIYDKISRTTPDIRNANGTALHSTSLIMDDILLGDVDFNGVVDENDADLILSHIANPSNYPFTEKQFQAADVYNQGDGMTGMDAYTIQQYVAGIISHF